MFTFRVIFRVFTVIGIILGALIAYEFGYRYLLWTLRAFRVERVAYRVPYTLAMPMQANRRWRLACVGWHY
jgi:hypothetical protein